MRYGASFTVTIKMIIYIWGEIFTSYTGSLKSYKIPPHDVRYKKFKL